MIGKSAQRHLDAIERGEVTKSNVIGMRKAINTAERVADGYSVGSTSPRMTVTETIEMRARLMVREPRVCGELHESGLKVLRDRRYKNRWTEAQQAIINYSALSFRLHSFQIVGRGYAVPVYRAVGDDRMGSFLFRNLPWQTAWVTGEESGPVIIQERGK